MAMNLIQTQSDLSAIPNTPMGLKMLMDYSQNLNPDVPGYMAASELMRRKMLEQSTQQAPANQGTVVQQLGNSLLQNPQVNPGAAPASVNPAGQSPLVDPTAAQRQSAGITDMTNNAATPGDGPEPAPDVQDGVASLFGGGSAYAGGGMVAFKDNPDQPVDEDMPADNTQSGLRTLSSADDSNVSGGPNQNNITVTDDGLASLQKAPAQVPKSALPVGITPDMVKMESPEQIYAAQKAIQKMTGVSDDPYADVKAARAAIDARHAEKYASDPIDRLLGQLSAFGSADPTKGFGYQMGIGAKESQAIKEKQLEYRDKQEELSVAFKQQMAKEDDARARGDAAGVQKSIADQKKIIQDIAKLKIDEGNMLANQTSAGAAARNAASTAAQVTALNDLRIAQAEAARAGILTKDEKNLIEREKAEARAREEKEKAEAKEKAAEDKRVTDATRLLENDKGYQRWSEMTKDQGSYPLGTPEGNAVDQYMKDYKQAVIDAARENRKPILPAPPAIVKEIVDSGYNLPFIGKFGEKSKETLKYGKSAPSESSEKPKDQKIKKWNPETGKLE